MSAAVLQTLWDGSQLAELASRTTAVIAAKNVKLRIGVGPQADALAAAPPAITFVDGVENEERYEEPAIQPDNGHAVLDALQDFEIVIRGRNVKQADELREALFAVFADEQSWNGIRPIRGRRRGGNESQEGFSIVVRAIVRWQLLRDVWNRVEFTGIDAVGNLVGHGGADPEQITEASTA